MTTTTPSRVKITAFSMTNSRQLRLISLSSCNVGFVTNETDVCQQNAQWNEAKTSLSRLLGKQVWTVCFLFLSIRRGFTEFRLFSDFKRKLAEIELHLPWGLRKSKKWLLTVWSLFWSREAWEWPVGNWLSRWLRWRCGPPTSASVAVVDALWPHTWGK